MPKSDLHGAHGAGCDPDIARDPTGRTQEEPSEARYRLLIDAARVSMVVVQDGLLKFANPMTQAMFGGASEQELLDRPFSDLVHPDDRGLVAEDHRQRGEAEAEQPPSRYDIRVLARDGEVRWAEVNAAPIEWHSRPATLKVLTDITERKRAEAVLLQEGDDWGNTFDSLTDMVTVHDKNYDIVRANRSARQMLHLPLLGKLTTPAKCFRSYHGTDTPPDGCPSCRSLAAEQPCSSEIFEPHLGKYLEIRAIPRFDTRHRCIGLVHVVRDISERKRAEAQLRQAQRMEAIGHLAGGVAHDFNNLLTGILGSIALMRNSLPSPDPLLEILDAAEACARQAADLTKGLLTFSRSDVVLPVPMKVAAALDATLVMLRQTLPATMEIVRDYEQTPWNVLVDQSQITQILINLALNARDAMKGKGTLTIRTRNMTVDTAYVREHSYARTGEFVRISVSDTGPGIPTAILEHLFEPFHTTKPLGSGTGLGLSIVFGAVRQAGGWITAVSTGGVGATFDIYLPRCMEEPGESFTPGPLSEIAGRGTILVIEDQPVVRAVVQTLLSSRGYTLLTAPDGPSALDILRTHPVGLGLILLDMTTPGMTAGEIVKAIRALDPTVPILLNSGYASDDTVQHMLEEGAVQGFLGKPHDMRRLMEEVHRLIQGGGGGP